MCQHSFNLFIIMCFHGPKSVYFLFFLNNNIYFKSEIGQLSKLSLLYLYVGSFTGSLPSELGQLTELSNGIRMHNNPFSGTIPSQLGALTSIGSFFTFYTTQLSGSIPSELGRLTKVAYFRIDSNELCGKRTNYF